MKALPIAALAALMLQGAPRPAWALNPEGSGQLRFGFNALTAFDSEQGTEWQGAVDYQDHEVDRQDLGWDGRGVIALGQASALELGVTTDQFVRVDGRSNTSDGHYYDEQQSIQSWSLNLGFRSGLGAYFGRFWDPDVDHPYGVLYWPVLWVRGTWLQSSESYTLQDNVGFSYNYPPDLDMQTLSVNAGVDWPLTRRLALNASLGRDLLNLAEQGAGLGWNEGSYEAYSLGGSFDLPWRPEVATESYFPRQGRPGKLRLSLAWNWTLNKVSGAETAEGPQASVDTLVGAYLDLQLGWSASHAFRGPYDSRAAFIPTQQVFDSQRVFGALTFCFGDASQP